MFGKWHLGYREGYRPNDRGFDEFFGFLGGAHDYNDAHADSTNPIYRDNTRVDKIEYTTDDFAREAAAFIDRNKSNPFFVYVPFNAVHTPMHTAKRYQEKFKHITGESRRTYAGMLTALDDGVGTVLKALERHGLTKDTLVFFLTDNGGPTPVNTSRNGPLRGYKAQVWDGGIRVPFVLQWPAKVPKGKVYRNPVIALDILPTAVAAAGGKPDASWKLDGVDLVPFITGSNKGVPHERLFWRFGQQYAMREGDWKLTKFGDKPELFNLAKDIGESTDLAEKEAARYQAMTQAWNEWNRKNVAPLWAPSRPGAQKKKKKKAA